MKNKLAISKSKFTKNIVTESIPIKTSNETITKASPSLEIPEDYERFSNEQFKYKERNFLVREIQYVQKQYQSTLPKK